MNKEQKIGYVCFVINIILFFFVVLLPYPYWILFAILQWNFILLQLISYRLEILRSKK
jgi:hypothetical protein